MNVPATQANRLAPAASGGNIEWGRFEPTVFTRNQNLGADGVYRDIDLRLRGTIGGQTYEVKISDDGEVIGYPLGMARPNTQNRLMLGETRALAAQLSRTIASGTPSGDAVAFLQLLSRPLNVALAAERYNPNAPVEKPVVDAAGIDLSSDSQAAKDRRAMYAIGSLPSRGASLTVLNVSMPGETGLVSVLFVARQKLGPADVATGEVELIRVE